MLDRRQPSIADCHAVGENRNGQRRGTERKPDWCVPTKQGSDRPKRENVSIRFQKILLIAENSGLQKDQCIQTKLRI